MREIDLTVATGAIFSDDGQYRYALWRIWSPPRPVIGYLGLNSSTAGALNNDPTISRNMIRSEREGFGGMIQVNMYGFITPNPAVLLQIEDAIGELNDYYIREMDRLTKRQVCMWGSFKPVKLRADDVYKMLSNPYCLGANQDGEPKHSLYVRYDTKMMKYCR